jgi:hypothetical protein
MSVKALEVFGWDIGVGLDETRQEPEILKLFANLLRHVEKLCIMQEI